MSVVPHSAKIQLSDEIWRQRLPMDKYLVLRKKCTEKKGKGEYNKFQPKNGYFACDGCGNPLYSWKSKFEANCGWPSFDKCFKDSVCTVIDDKYVKIEKYIHQREVEDETPLLRLEICCYRCDGHLGHIFPHKLSYHQGNRANQRHCVNSKSIKYVNESPPKHLIESTLNINILYQQHIDIDIDHTLNKEMFEMCKLI